MFIISSKDNFIKISSINKIQILINGKVIGIVNSLDVVDKQILIKSII